MGALYEGNDTTESDVDLTVDLAKVEGISPAHQYFDFKAELEQLLERQVDLVELASTQDSRLKRIIERTQILVDGPEARLDCRDSGITDSRLTVTRLIT